MKQVVFLLQCSFFACLSASPFLACRPQSAHVAVSSPAAVGGVASAIQINGLAEWVMTAGERAVFEVTLGNTSEGEVAITTYKASCECVALEGLPVNIFGQETIPASIIVDLGREVAFVGNLAVNLSLRSVDEEVGSAVIKVRVVPAPEPDCSDYPPN